jgi:hypothetical protein
VFGQHERPGLQHQNAVAPGLVSCEQVLRQGRAKRATADHDDIEWARAGAGNGALDRLIQPVADITPTHVTRKIGYLSLRTCCNCYLLAMLTFRTIKQQVKKQRVCSCITGSSSRLWWWSLKLVMLSFSVIETTDRLQRSLCMRLKVRQWGESCIFHRAQLIRPCSG